MNLSCQLDVIDIWMLYFGKETAQLVLSILQLNCLHFWYKVFSYLKMNNLVPIIIVTTISLQLDFLTLSLMSSLSSS